MDLLHLEHFLAVVEEGTFTRAAERMNRTQPAISQSVRRLEDEIGSPLFARDVHEVTLTEAGRVLADYARRLLTMRDDALRDVSELRTLKAGPADDRRARVRRGVPAAGAAAELPAEVPEHQGRHQAQPPGGDPAAGHGSRSRRRLRQGRAGVS